MFRSRATTYSGHLRTSRAGAPVVALLLILTASIASGQQPKRKVPPPPFPLLPAEQTWLVTLDGTPAAAAAMDAERVYVPLQTGNVAAVDRQDGTLLWTVPLATRWPIVTGPGAIYVGSDQALVALDPSTGLTRWEKTFERSLIAAPVHDAGRVIVVLAQGDYVSLNAGDGTEQWRLRIDNHAPLFSPLPGGDQRLYVSLDNGDIVAISANDGDLVWRRTIGGTLSEPAWAPEHVFVGSTDNHFYALDADDGELQWRWRLGGDVIGSAMDATGGVYVASLDNMLRRLNQGNGNQRWREELTSRPALPPRVIKDIVVATGVAPVVTAYGTLNGTVTGTYAAPGDLQGAPLIDPALTPFRVSMVVLTRDGRLVGLTPVAAQYREPVLNPLLQLPGARLSREPHP